MKTRRGNTGDLSFWLILRKKELRLCVIPLQDGLESVVIGFSFPFRISLRFYKNIAALLPHWVNEWLSEWRNANKSAAVWSENERVDIYGTSRVVWWIVKSSELDEICLFVLSKLLNSFTLDDLHRGDETPARPLAIDRCRPPRSLRLFLLARLRGHEPLQALPHPSIDEIRRLRPG